MLRGRPLGTVKGRIQFVPRTLALSKAAVDRAYELFGRVPETMYTSVRIRPFVASWSPPLLPCGTEPWVAEHYTDNRVKK